MSIKRDTERLEAVREILNKLDYTPSSHDLELMASYILYGEDENGLNAVKRGEISDSTTRYSSYRRKIDQNASLDALMENPMVTQDQFKPLTSRNIYLKKRPSIKRIKYDEQGNIKDIGDGDIPGMIELWESIDRIAHIIAVSEGSVAPTEDDHIVDNPYHLYKLKHQLIDLRRHQYYLLDGYKPTIHFANLDPPRPQYNTWDSDAYYWLPQDQWEAKAHASLLPLPPTYETRVNPYTGEPEVKWIIRRQVFNWENVAHVRAFISLYHNLYHQLHEKLSTDGCFLLYDFDYYVKMAHLPQTRLYILQKTRAGYTNPQIAAALEHDLNIIYTDNYIGTILLREIPKKIAAAATRRRLLVETPMEERKVCANCGRPLPLTTDFFARNRSHADGYASCCKECERYKRITKGGQSQYDRRVKETAMLALPPRKTNN